NILLFQFYLIEIITSFGLIDFTRLFALLNQLLQHFDFCFFSKLFIGSLFSLRQTYCPPYHPSPTEGRVASSQQRRRNRSVYFLFTMVPLACAVGIINKSLILTCAGLDSTKAITSAISSPQSGVSP